MKKKVLVLGDSHTNVFTKKFKREYFNSIDWHVIQVHGATLSGLSNPNSKTRTIEKFTNALNDNKYDAIIINLGEVDCGFVIYFYAERDNICEYSAANKALTNYCKLIKEARAVCKNIYIISTPIPTIPDGVTHGDVANARKSIKATQLARTNLTLWFNEKVKEICSEIDYNINYIDLDKDVLSKSGLVRDVYLNKFQADHHYDIQAYCELLERRLIPKLESDLFNNSNYTFNDLLNFTVGNNQEKEKDFLDWLDNRFESENDLKWFSTYKELCNFRVRIKSKERCDFFLHHLKDRFIKSHSSHYILIAAFLFHGNSSIFKRFLSFSFNKISGLEFYKKIDLDNICAVLRGNGPVTLYRNYDFKPTIPVNKKDSDYDTAYIFLSYINNSKALSHRYLLSGFLNIAATKYKKINVYISNEALSLSPNSNSFFESSKTALDEVKELISLAAKQKTEFHIHNPTNIFNSKKEYLKLLKSIPLNHEAIGYHFSGSHFSPLFSHFFDGKIPRVDIQCQSNIRIKKSADLTIVRENVHGEKTYYMPLVSLTPKNREKKRDYQLNVKSGKLNLVISAKAGKILMLLKSNPLFYKAIFECLDASNVFLEIVGCDESKLIKHFPELKKHINLKVRVSSFIDDFESFLESNQVYIIPPGMSGGGMSTRIAAQKSLVIISCTKFGDAVKFSTPDLRIEAEELSEKLKLINNKTLRDAIIRKQHDFLEREFENFEEKYRNHLSEIHSLVNNRTSETRKSHEKALWDRARARS